MASSPWSPIDDNTNNASSNGTAPSHIADNELGPLPAPYLASRTDSGYDSCVPIQMPIQMPIPRTDFNTAHFCESPSHWGVDLTPDNRVMTQGNIGCSAFNNYSSVHTFELPDAAVGYK